MMNRKFVMAVKADPELAAEKGLVFAFQGDQILLLNAEGSHRVPDKEEFRAMKWPQVRSHYLSTLDGEPCFAVELKPDTECLAQEAALHGLREVFDLIDSDLFSVAGYALQIVNWDRMHQFCGRCGSLTRQAEEERAKICDRCAAIFYPRVSPVIIVAVRREGKLLLVRNNHYRRNFYTVIAGFVEPGENLEECLVREVREETGIEVKNIRYFASQSWPFPSSLMVGFEADYAGGELRLDQQEIADAGWFAPDDLPRLPGSISIARWLIDSFAKER